MVVMSQHVIVFLALTLKPFPNKKMITATIALSLILTNLSAKLLKKYKINLHLYSIFQITNTTIKRENREVRYHHGVNSPRQEVYNIRTALYLYMHLHHDQISMKKI